MYYKIEKINFIKKGFFCLKIHVASRRLNESCEVHLQCKGSRNAGVCGENKTCICDKGFIKLQEGCLTGKYSIIQSVCIPGIHLV